MKKSFIYFVVLTSIFLSCSGGGDGDPGPDPDPVNTAPSIPVQVYPLNNTLCINNNVVFEWNASIDNEGNTITYQVEVSENNDFSTLSNNLSSSSTSRVIILEKGKSYYWRLKSKDSKGAESGYSSVSHFLTEGDGISNHLPFAPVLVEPALNAEVDGTSVTLSWTASDLDNDVLTFDIYLDTNPNPTTLVSENQSGTSYNATGLSATSTYYFKVVVKDEKGGVTKGQIWSFTTK